MSTKECAICAESSEKFVSCCDPSCTSGDGVCVKCAKTYILSKLNASCMYCNTEWNHKHLLSQFGSWINSNTTDGYRTMYKKMILEIETAKLADTTALMYKERVTRSVRIAEQFYGLLYSDLYDNIVRLNKQLTRLRSMLHDLRKHNDNEIYQSIVKQRIDTILNKTSATAIQKNIDNIYKTSRALIVDGAKYRIDKIGVKIQKASVIKHLYVYSTQDSIDTVVFVCPCPSECNGRIHSSSYKCTICDSKVCKKCLCLLQKDHTCDPDTVKTVKKLREKNDTKPCPTCSALVFKIEGCDQMFCTQCKSVYSWKTGKLTNDTVHNPHAIAYQRQGGTIDRNYEDVPCGGITDLYRIKISRSYTNMIGHIGHVIQETRENQVNNDARLYKARKEYILYGNRKKWERSTFLTYRKIEKTKIYLDLLVLMRHIVAESLNDYDHSNDSAQDRKNLLVTRLNSIFDFIDGQMKEHISDVYNSKIMSIRRILSGQR